MKIAIITTSFPNVSETFIINQITDFIDLGNDVKIFSLKETKNTIIHEKVKDYDLLNKVVYVDLNRIYGYSFYRISEILKFLFSNNSIKTRLKLIKTLNFLKLGSKSINLFYPYLYSKLFLLNEYDIVLVHYGYNGVYISDFKKCGIFKDLKMYTYFHGTDIIPSFVDTYKNKYKDVFKESKILFTNSKYSKDILLKVDISIEDKIEIVPVGVDLSSFNYEWKFDKEKGDIKNFNLIFCGRLVGFKNPLLTIDIFKGLKAKNEDINFYFLIIGSGPLLKSLEERIIEEGFSRFIKVYGSLNDVKLKKVLSESDVFLYTGIIEKETLRAENQGLVIQEAQALGVPVVASNVGGVKYGLIHNESGFLVNENDVEEFVEKCQILISDKNLREKMGRNGNKFIVNNFDSKKLSQTMCEMFSK